VRRTVTEKKPSAYCSAVNGLVAIRVWRCKLRLSDPYCRTPCLWLCPSVCLSAARLVPYRQRPRNAAKLAASRATSPTGLSVCQGSYRSGNTGKSQGIGVVRERRGEIFFWGKVCQKSVKMKNWCHQMSDFQAKMHQIRFPLGLDPTPHWGSLQRSPRRPSCT